MNKAESAAVEDSLIKAGHDKAISSDMADLIIINTCSVRISAENRVWGRIALYSSKKRKHDFTLIVTGCMAERMKEEMIKAEPAIDYVIGNFQKDAIIRIAEKIAQKSGSVVIREKPYYEFASNHQEAGSFRSFVPIMHGCNNFCTYCIVPYLRGREISRAPSEILKELDILEESGVREVTLLGQNVNSWIWKNDFEEAGFSGLLSQISNHLKKRKDEKPDKFKGIKRLRFLTSHPKDFSDELIRVLASDQLFCHHIHLCVQHGSDRILELMNRKYTADQYLKLIERIKNIIPDVSFSTDILIGFPGETEEDVELTLELMRKVGFIYSYMYYFNPRSGTKAASMENQIPGPVKKARLARVIALQKELSARSMSQYVGSTFEVLVEDISKRKKTELLGRTSQDMMVVFPGEISKIGTFVNVRIESVSGNTFKAKEIL